MIIRTVALMAVLVINVSSNYIEELISRAEGSTKDRILTYHNKITQSGFISLFELKVYARNLVHVARSFEYDREQFVQIFVRLLHQAIQDGGALTQERVNEIWFEAIQEIRMSHERGMSDIILQESIAQSGYVPSTQLGIAIVYGNLEEVDKLLADTTYDVDQQQGEALFVAVLKNDIPMVTRLLGLRSNLAVGEARCLWTAMALGYDEIICLLANYEGNDSN